MWDGRVAESVELDAPLAEAYAFVSDIRNDPLWWRGVKKVDPVAGEDDVYDEDVSLLCVRQCVRVHVSEAQPPHRAVLTADNGRVAFTATYLFDELSPTRTRYAVDATVSGRGVYRLLGPLFIPLLRVKTRRDLRTLAAHMRAQVNSRTGAA
jgi:hypothetical protein